MFLEAEVLTALNIGEAVSTKISTLNELKKHVEKRLLENKLRDFIYANPWIISPEWERFAKEISLTSVIKKAGVDNFPDEIYKGRVDMVLGSGSQLVVLEFMRLGLELDKDHLNRFDDYIITIKSSLDSQTGVTPTGDKYTVVAGYLIADN